MSLPDSRLPMGLRSNILAKRGPAGALLAVPVVGFALFLWTYAVNVPWLDDINAFVESLLNYTRAQTGPERAQRLLEPNNEHRMLLGKSLSLLIYYVTGELNFRAIILVAGGFLFATLALFFRVFRSLGGRNALPVWAFLPVPLLLLQPQYYHTSLWAITAAQHQVVVFMILLAVYWLAQGSRPGFGGALLCQVLATFSMGNGLFGWAGGAVVLAGQRRWARLVVWVALGAVSAWLYFRGFASAQGNESSVTFLLRYPYLVVAGFFTFTGGLFDFFPKAPILLRSVLPTLAGLGIIGGIFWTLRPVVQRWAGRLKPLTPTALFLAGSVGFLLVNAGVVAVLRPRFGYGVMLVSNYMLYPALWGCVLYLAALHYTPRPRGVVLFGIAVSAVVWVTMYVLHWPGVAERAEQLRAYGQNQQRNGLGLGASANTPFEQYVQGQMVAAQQAGLYRYPVLYSSLDDATLQRLLQTAPSDSSLRLNATFTGVDLRVEGEASRPFTAGSVVLKADRYVYLLPVETFYERPVFFRPARPVTGVVATLYAGGLWPATYRLGLLSRVEGVWQLRFSSQTIVVPQS